MIQRIQSIWLLLAALTIFILLAVPIAGIQHNEDGLFLSTPLSMVAVAVGLVCIGSIFSFKNRTLQKRIILITILLIIVLAFLIFNYVQQIPGGISSASCGVGTFLPPLAILFCVLALRGIRKDEQLLRSADRLR